MSKKKKKPDDVHVIEDGEYTEFFPGADFVYFGCCDCNLVHHLSVYEIFQNKKGQKFYRPIQKPIAIRLCRDDEATNWRRRKKK